MSQGQLGLLEILEKLGDKLLVEWFYHAEVYEHCHEFLAVDGVVRFAFVLIFRLAHGAPVWVCKAFEEDI
jgi:hypothetical protein